MSRRTAVGAAAAAVTAGLLLSGCSSDGHTSASPSAGSSSARSAGSSPGTASGRPSGTASAAAPASGRATATTPPAWRTPALTALKADTVSQRLASRWGLEFHRSDLGADRSGSLPPHTSWEALKELPDGYSFSVLLQSDTDGSLRNAVCVARKSVSEKVAETLAQCLDTVLDGKATARQKSWISEQLAAARSGQAAPSGPASLVENSLVTLLSAQTEETDLQIYRQPS
ncbi:hypothetical protein ABT095_06885 [Kitasatospora sp. NPDC002227]|uniref:hypothetical protein n=1 Tax=Kitasatospora sp. NPDC002227 TaxID=3154773 RepID=UPI00332D37F8